MSRDAARSFLFAAGPAVAFARPPALHGGSSGWDDWLGLVMVLVGLGVAFLWTGRRGSKRKR